MTDIYNLQEGREKEITQIQGLDDKIYRVLQKDVNLKYSYTNESHDGCCGSYDSTHSKWLCLSSLRLEEIVEIPESNQ